MLSLQSSRLVAIVGWNAVAMYVMGIEYNPMTACLGSMTIGVAAEYTILVMERYIEEREKTENVIEAIKNSVQKIGSAIMVSGFATFFGFSALTLSTFPIISNFGITTIIAVLFSLIGAIAVMPAVLSLADQIVNGVKNVEKEIHEYGGAGCTVMSDNKTPYEKLDKSRSAERIEGVDILTGDPKSAILKLSIPVMLAMLLSSSYNVVNAIWVAGLGSNELAAVGFYFR